MRIVAIVCLLAFPTIGRAATVDWKMYGGLDAPRGRTYCFYEERGIRHPQKGLVRVWVKCLLQKDLDGISPKDDYYRAYLDMSASRIAHYYLPPIAKISRMDKAQMLTAIMYETAADVGDLTQHGQIFYELDCVQRKERELKVEIEDNTSRHPLDWSDVGPEGNAANLMELLCPAR